MHPVFLEFNGIVIHTYGVMAALGFLIAIYTASYTAKKQKLDPENINDLAVWVIVGAVLGARIFYVLVEFDYFVKNPLEVFKIWKGGLVFYGGFIFAAITAFLYIKFKNLPLGKTADSIAPAIAIGHSIGRMGCLFAGCCYGRPTKLPIGIVFSDKNSLAPLNESLHPTQIYSVLSNFLIFIILVLYLKKKKRDGDVFLLYLLLYGVFRIIIEYFRGDNRGNLIFQCMSTSQAMGLFAIILSLLIFMFSRYGVLKKNNG